MADKMIYRIFVFLTSMLFAIGTHADVGTLEINQKAYWVDSTVCTVVVKASIDSNRPLQPTTPIDQLSSLATTCMSNLTGQNTVSGGVRSLLGLGHRITALSHTVTALPTGSNDGKSEMLISAIFCLERPQTAEFSMPRLTR